MTYSIKNIKKIDCKGYLVSLKGDEMAQVMWQLIQDNLILPFINLNIEEYDLSLTNRDATNDEVTKDAAIAIKKHGVGVKCATITPTAQQTLKLGLKRQYSSPNATIRNYLNGTIFREPIICDIPKLKIVRKSKPVIIARHGFGDVYAASDAKIESRGVVKCVFHAESGETIDIAEIKYNETGVFCATYNLVSSIRGFAKTCFSYALERKLPLFFSSKDTILKNYDGTFRDIFAEVFKTEFQNKFENLGLIYEHRLIDDMVAYWIKSDGGFVWACKNYDGDVQSDALAQSSGSLGLMTSVLINETGDIIVAEAAHGTVSRHYKMYLEGLKTSTNPVASIFAWSIGLKYLGNAKKCDNLINFSFTLERACEKNLIDGFCTKDISCIADLNAILTTDEFIKRTQNNLIAALYK